MENNFYLYQAYVTDVYDGDTITCDINLGFGIKYTKQKIRLYGIDTPELRGEEREEGLRVRDYVREKILNKNIILHSYRDSKGKYGRYLGDIYYDNINLNKELLEKKMAKKYD
jgi:micrococcal nuclease|tara:strand:- start:50 stop:388 length:339 start_codon:yes stop_codon:yes gene_type:complete